MPNDYPDGTVDDGANVAAPELLADLRAAGIPHETSSLVRAAHGRDWGPLTIPAVAEGRVPRWPGVVVRPRSNDEVSGALVIAGRHGVAVTAQGGRSSV